MTRDHRPDSGSGVVVGCTDANTHIVNSVAQTPTFHQTRAYQNYSTFQSLARTRIRLSSTRSTACSPESDQDHGKNKLDPMSGQDDKQISQNQTRSVPYRPQPDQDRSRTTPDPKLGQDQIQINQKLTRSTAWPRPEIDQAILNLHTCTSSIDDQNQTRSIHPASQHGWITGVFWGSGSGMYFQWGFGFG